MTKFPERNWNNSYETSELSRLPSSGNKFSSKVLRKQKMADMHSGLFIFAVLALESVTINLLSLFPLKIKLCMCMHVCTHVHACAWYAYGCDVWCVCTFSCTVVCTAETHVCLWKYGKEVCS